jgi:hypothetical protein
MTERVFEFAMNGVATATSPASGPKPPRSAALHITYAVEIEGEAPLYFSIEAVDE